MSADGPEGGAAAQQRSRQQSLVGGSGPTSASAAPVTELDRVVAYANRFSIKLFKHVAALDARCTVCIGPFTVFRAMCAAYAGAQGNTEHQMAKAFKVDIENVLHVLANTLHGEHEGRKADPQRRPHMEAICKDARMLRDVNKRFDMAGALHVLLELLRHTAAGADVRHEMSCHAFVERSFPLAAHFEALLEHKHQAQMHRVDMKDEPDSVREHVNSTVEKDTSGAIPQLLVSGVTDPDSRVVFYDSLYVKAAWEGAFPATAAATEKHPYTVSSGRSPALSMGGGNDRGPELVRISGVYRHCRDPENKLLAVEVPLGSGQLSLLLFLADNAPSLRRLHKHFSLELYERLLDKLQDTGERISVLVPKMHVEEMLQPSYVLKHMGFLDLFDEHANLSGVGGKSLFVSDIIHKVALTLDTTGVTAAAAVSLSLTDFYTEELPKAYRDVPNSRPLIYIVKNQETDLILFMGAVQDI